jgi:hypothetical protein
VPGAAGYTEQKSGSTESMSPSSGAPGPQSARMSDQDVKKRIEQAGYSSVSDVDRSKNGGYTAQAMRNGKRVTVDVDSSGRIMSK